MKSGKLTIEQLNTIVFPYTGQKRPEVKVHAAIGKDCAVVDLNDQLCVISTDPITGASKDNGYLGVHVACNDVIASGGKPLGILVTLLLKEGTEEEDIITILEGTNAACKELGIEIIGGHTEITASVKENILSLTAMGTRDKKFLEEHVEVAPGDEIILTKGGAIEGTSILYNDYSDYFEGKVNPELISQGKEMLGWLSVLKEGTIGIDNGAKLMHDVTEGGILGGVYEIAASTNLGVRLYEKEIYFHPATVELKKVFPDLDLLRLISSGSLLIIAPPGSGIREKLDEAGIKSFLIGHFTEEPEKLLQHPNDSVTAIEEPKSDELWSVKDRLKER